MSQPFDRACVVPPPGEVDEDLGEFWTGSPWLIATKHNLSAFERNRSYLNVEGRDFVDVSYLTGMDSDGDGRNAVAADINNDGRLDMLVRQAGGGALVVYENGFPQQHWLRVSLRGVESNSLGIGARLVATTDTMTIVRELFPVNSYRAQAPAQVQLGLSDHTTLSKLEILWPSGKRQTLTDIPADQHIEIREDSDKWTVYGKSQTAAP